MRYETRDATIARALARDEIREVLARYARAVDRADADLLKSCYFDDASWDTFTGGRLHDRFEHRNGEWKIAHRRTIFDWNRDTAANEGWCLGYIDPRAPGVLRGRKDDSDPSYERF